MRRNQNLVLSKLLELWAQYLTQDDPYAMPVSLLQIPLLIDTLKDAGTLSQIEALGFYIDRYVNILADKDIPDTTKGDFYRHPSAEERFARERWSMDDRRVLQYLQKILKHHRSYLRI